MDTRSIQFVISLNLRFEFSTGLSINLSLRALLPYQLSKMVPWVAPSMFGESCLVQSTVFLMPLASLCPNSSYQCAGSHLCYVLVIKALQRSTHNVDLSKSAFLPIGLRTQELRHLPRTRSLLSIPELPAGNQLDGSLF